MFIEAEGMKEPGEVFKIGYIQRTHGLGGEVEMKFTDDVFDRTDADYLFLRVDGLIVPFFFEEYRFKNDETIIVKFEGVDDSNYARKICGAEVLFPVDMIPTQRENFCSWDFLTGFRVEAEGEPLGSVRCVDRSSANILLLIDRADGSELYVPLHEDFIESCDEPSRLLKLRLPDGLLTINDRNK